MCRCHRTRNQLPNKLMLSQANAAMPPKQRLHQEPQLLRRTQQQSLLPRKVTWAVFALICINKSSSFVANYFGCSRMSRSPLTFARWFVSPPIVFFVFSVLELFAHDTEHKLGPTSMCTLLTSHKYRLPELTLVLFSIIVADFPANAGSHLCQENHVSVRAVKFGADSAILWWLVRDLSNSVSGEEMAAHLCDFSSHYRHCTWLGPLLRR